MEADKTYIDGVVEHFGRILHHILIGNAAFLVRAQQNNALDGWAKLGNCFQGFGHLSNSEKSGGSDKIHLSSDFVFKQLIEN